jgi:hypothetical protein
MMFGYFRCFSIFCTIIIVVFIAGTSMLTFRAIASDSVNQNTSAQNNPPINQECRTLPKISQTTHFVTPHINQQPTQSHQNLRYIIPVTLQQENQPNNQLTTQPTEQPANLPTNQPTNQTQEITTTPTQPNNVTKKQTTPTPAQLPTSPTNTTPEAGANWGTGNPFQYHELEGSIGLIPRNISSLPAGIQVIGIMILNEQKSIAAIRLPKTTNTRNTTSAQNSDVFYVREGDIIEVPTGALPTSRANRAITNPSPEILFLVVEKITSQHVEVRSRSNIADKHILR